MAVRKRAALMHAPVARHRLLVECVVIALLLFAAALASAIDHPASATGTLRRLDALIYDSLRRLTPVPAAAGLILVDIDDDSLAQLGAWPWPRSLHAEALRRLRDAGARAIALDVLLAEDSRGDDALERELAAHRAAGRPVVLPMVAPVDRSGATTPMYPLPRFGLHATLAHAHFPLDDDGQVRGVHIDEGGFPALALAMFDASGVPAASRPALRDRLARARDRSTPASRDAALAAGNWSRGDYLLLPQVASDPVRVSVAALLRGEIDPARIRDRSVLIGATAHGLGDRYASPVIGDDALAAGVELHAAAFTALASGGSAERAPLSVAVAAAAALMALLMTGLYRLGPRGGLLATVVALAAVPAGSASLLAAGWWLPPGGMLLAVVAAYPLWSWRRLEAAVADLRRQSQAMIPDASAPVVPLADLPARRLPAEPMARDLARLAHAAARARSLQLLLATTIRRLPIPALVVDERGRLQLGNDRLREAFGALPPAGADCLPWLSNSFEPDPQAWLLQGSDGSRVERADRQRRDWLIDVTVHPSPEGPALRLLQFVEISAIRAAQRERDQMLHFLSHDLRTPLAAILAIIELEDGPAPRDPTLLGIRDQALRALSLSDGFVQLARAESKALEHEPVSLPDLAIEAADSCWEVAALRRVRVSVQDRSAGEEAIVAGDAQLLRRALVNLIDNAVKYGPPESEVQVVVEAATDPDGWCVSVLDDGAGLDDAALAQVFDPWWQGDASNQRGGAGLGLAFVRTVAERHGARVRASRAEPRGTVFSLLFRADSPRSPAAPAEGRVQFQ